MKTFVDKNALQEFTTKLVAKLKTIFSKTTANPTLSGTESDLTALQIDNIKYKIASATTYTAGTGINIANNIISVAGVSFLTTAPSAANTSGDLKFVVLNSDPATKYNGYIYIITGA